MALIVNQKDHDTGLNKQIGHQHMKDINPAKAINICIQLQKPKSQEHRFKHFMH